jgi:hypothetical protein
MRLAITTYDYECLTVCRSNGRTNIRRKSFPVPEVLLISESTLAVQGDTVGPVMDQQ